EPHQGLAFGEKARLALGAAPVGNADGDDAVGQGLARGDPQSPAVHESALALFGGEQLVVDGIVSYGGYPLALALQRNGDGKKRDAMQKIASAVERVDDPAVCLVRAFDRAALLHEEAVAWPGFGQLPVERLLGTVIGAAGKVGGALDRHLQLLQ